MKVEEVFLLRVAIITWAPAGRASGGDTCPAPWECCKVFCALAVTVNTCLGRRLKKGRRLFSGKKCPPPWKNPAGTHKCVRSSVRP